MTPKMHMLEDHVVPFLREWHVGFGFHREQGAESLHAVLRINAKYRHHHLQVSPPLQAQEPVHKGNHILHTQL